VATSEASGRNVANAASGPLRLFFENAKGTLRYEGILREPKGEAFLVIDGTQQVVGSHTKAGEGHILFTPHFIDKGLSFVAGIVAWYEVVTRTITHEPEPPWSTAVAFDLELREQAKVDALDEQVKGITALYAAAVQTYDKLRAWKRLIYGTGDELEDQVGQALSLFGFAVQPGPPGRDDFVVEADGTPAVVEVKGVTGSASETYAAQLEKWASTYAADHNGLAPKAILVVNAFRDKPLPERTQPVFPDQMLRYSEQREHCLVSGVQLLGMVVDVLANPAGAGAVRQLLTSTKGRLEGYDDYRAFLSEKAEGTSDTTT